MNEEVLRHLRVTTPKPRLFPLTLLTRIALGLTLLLPSSGQASSRRQSAEEWRRLNGTNAPLPRIVANPHEIRFYFPAEPRPIGFIAGLAGATLPTYGYQLSS